MTFFDPVDNSVESRARKGRNYSFSCKRGCEIEEKATNRVSKHAHLWPGSGTDRVWSANCGGKLFDQLRRHGTISFFQFTPWRRQPSVQVVSEFGYGNHIKIIIISKFREILYQNYFQLLQNRNFIPTFPPEFRLSKYQSSTRILHLIVHIASTPSNLCGMVRTIFSPTTIKTPTQIWR